MKAYISVTHLFWYDDEDIIKMCGMEVPILNEKEVTEYIHANIDEFVDNYMTLEAANDIEVQVVE